MTDSAVRTTLRTVIVISTVLAAGAFTTMVWAHGTGRLTESDVPTTVMISIGLGAVVWIASAQQPRNRLLWVITTFVASVGWFAAATAARSIMAPEVPFRLMVETTIPAELPTAAAWLEYVALPLSSFSSALFLTFGLMLFPDGRLPSKRWRPVAVVAGVFLAIGLVRYLIIWHPDSTYVLSEHPLFHLLSPVDVSLPLVAFAAVIVRYRKADVEDRRRFKWMVWGLGVFVPLTIIGWLSGLTVITAVANLLLIGTYGIAITRHHLFDVEVVISRTLVFVVLVGFITAVYAAVVAGVGSLVGGSNVGWSIAATALVAVVFEPVRNRVHRWVNRLVYGRRATPYEVLSDLTGRLAATEWEEGLLDRMAQRLAEGTGADRAIVWSANEAGLVPSACEPPLESALESARSLDAIPGSVTPIVHDGVVLGALSVESRRGDALTPTEQRLVEDLAGSAALLMRRLGLDQALEQKAAELEESRRRLVDAQDVERRRLERELNHGAQQQVIALQLQLDVARQHAHAEGADTAATLIAQMTSETEDAIEQIRALANGIYPPLLEAEGLAAAVAALAEMAPIEVRVEGSVSGRHPLPAEGAAYFCISEALTNSIKHGEAPILVALSDRSGQLAFTVSDSGPGFDLDGVRRGSGLNNMTDRLDVLGGKLTIESQTGGRTTVSGAVPVAVHETVTA